MSPRYIPLAGLSGAAVGYHSEYPVEIALSYRGSRVVNEPHPVIHVCDAPTVTAGNVVCDPYFHDPQKYRDVELVSFLAPAPKPAGDPFRLEFESPAQACSLHGCRLPLSTNQRAAPEHIILGRDWLMKYSVTFENHMVRFGPRSLRGRLRDRW
jgi:hypothetical protein